MAQMVSLAEPEQMRILAIGNSRENIPTASSLTKSSEAGFTLIELMVAIAILAIVLTVAVLNIPNHDERYWRDNLDQLVSSLNMAQEESAMSGNIMLAQVDSVGWRFLNSAPNGSSINRVTRTDAASSSLMPDVYRSSRWYKPVEIAPLQLTLGGEQISQALIIVIKQDNRQALLERSNNGRFSWTKP